MLSFTRSFTRFVNRYVPSPYHVPARAQSFHGNTQAHPELTEGCESPFKNPARVTATHSHLSWLSPRSGASCRPFPTSGLQVVEIRVQASLQHLHNLLHRAVLNVVHALFQIGLQRKQRNKKRNVFTGHGTVPHRVHSGLLYRKVTSLDGGPLLTPGHAKQWLSVSGTPGQARSLACGKHSLSGTNVLQRLAVHCPCKRHETFLPF